MLQHGRKTCEAASVMHSDRHKRTDVLGGLGASERTHDAACGWECQKVRQGDTSDRQISVQLRKNAAYVVDQTDAAYTTMSGPRSMQPGRCATRTGWPMIGSCCGYGFSPCSYT